MLISLILTAASAFALDPSCSAPVWDGAHGMDGGQYKGTLSTECRVEGTSGGVATLDRFLRDSTATAGILHSGPTPESFSGMPGVLYDVTTTTAGADSIQIDGDFHIASDGTGKLAYAMISREVRGSGGSDLVRKIDFTFDVQGPSTDGFFVARIRQTLHLAKPWYAPGGIFTREAEKQFQQSFEPQVGSTLKDLREHL